MTTAIGDPQTQPKEAQMAEKPLTDEERQAIHAWAVALKKKLALLTHGEAPK